MSRRGLDVALAVLLFTLAFAVRLPNLQTLPRFTDEGREVLWAVDAFRNGLWPLTSVDAYDGPLFPYLLRAWFHVAGVSPQAPRALVLLLGSLSVVVVYFLASKLARDRRAGLLAAGLACANAPHILVNSHIAWSNCTTPLFSSLALLAYVQASRSGKLLLLPLAGVLYGLALQTHPYAIALAPALVLDVVLSRSRRSLLRSPAAYLSLFLSIGTYSPVIAHHLLTRGSDFALAEEREYSFEPHPTLATTWHNIGPTLTMTARVALGSLEPIRVGVEEPALEPSVVACNIILGLALVAMARRRGEPLPLLAAGTTLLFFAVFNRGHGVPLGTRYSQFLMPLLWTAFAHLFIESWDAATGRASPLTRAALAGVLALLVGQSLRGLLRYYEEQTAQGQTNRPLLTAVEIIRGDPRAPVVLYGRIAGFNRASPFYLVTRLRYLLFLDGRDMTIVPPPANLKVAVERARAADVAYLVAPSRAVRGDTPSLQHILELGPVSGQATDPALFRWARP